MWPFLESPIESHIWQSRLYIYNTKHIYVIEKNLKIKENNVGV